jgi:nucleotide-binding universal stress UspA family protein
MSEIFSRIVVPTDFSPSSEEAWALAQRLATALGSEVLLVHVFTEAPLWGEGPFNMEHVRETYATSRQWVSDKLEEWARSPRTTGLHVRPVLREGAPHEEIIALATDERADLILIGTQGRGGLNRALLGSVADRVVRLAPCPVLTVRESS